MQPESYIREQVIMDSTDRVSATDPMQVAAMNKGLDPYVVRVTASGFADLMDHAMVWPHRMHGARGSWLS